MRNLPNRLVWDITMLDHHIEYHLLQSSFLAQLHLGIKVPILLPCATALRNVWTGSEAPHHHHFLDKTLAITLTSELPLGFLDSVKLVINLNRVALHPSISFHRAIQVMP